MRNFNSGNHCQYLIYYHIILVCKYRKKLLSKYGEDIKNILIDISNKHDFKIKFQECDKDHIHLLIESEPKVSPLQIVRALKQESTITIWKKYSKDLQKHFWKERTFWTDGYFVATTGEVSKDIIEKYILNQGEGKLKNE